jgi:hypothetical protein
MKKAVKTLVLFTILTCILHSSHAQLKLTPPSAIANDVKKVIDDYPVHFANLMGPLIQENTQSSEYQCNFKVHGAEESTITRYSSNANNVYSWEALMLSTESFEKAKQKFRSLFNQLNNLSVSAGGSTGARLKGEYEMPVEEKKFASVVFSLSQDDESLKKLKVEVSLQYQLTEWKVKLLVYDKEREDAERGKTVEE